MITLHLTLAELDQLHKLMAVQTQAEFAPLLTKLDDALRQATVPRPCPVCQSSFTQLTPGRSAHYCSNACKQKAYRQRRDQARRKTPYNPTSS